MLLIKVIKQAFDQTRLCEHFKKIFDATYYANKPCKKLEGNDEISNLQNIHQAKLFIQTLYSGTPYQYYQGPHINIPFPIFPINFPLPL